MRTDQDIAKDNANRIGTNDQENGIGNDKYTFKCNEKAKAMDKDNAHDSEHDNQGPGHGT